MNIICGCYNELFNQYGPDLFALPAVQDAPEPWQRALQLCHQAEIQSPSSKPGLANICGRRPVHIPGGTIKVVAATCSAQFGSTGAVLLELLTNDSYLPEGLSVSPTFVCVALDTAYIPIFNVGVSAVMLPSCCSLRLLTNTPTVRMSHCNG